MNLRKLSLSVFAILALASCSDDETTTPKENITVLPLEVPTTYEFSRGDASTVSFDDQKSRILMLSDITSYIGKGTTQELSLSALNAMYTNSGATFTNTALAGVPGSIQLKDKTATSMAFFNGGNDESIAVQKIFTDAFAEAETASKSGKAAAAGQAGIYVPTTGSKRLFGANGLEPSQIVGKGMMGALLMDQVLNNFLSLSVLDAKNNRIDNANKVLVEGKNYTEMEHAWDQAYGYIYGGDDNTAATPVLKFWSSYIKQVNDQASVFGTLRENILNAFIKGRAAIAANNYAERDAQIAIIKENFSKIPAIRGVHYLYEGQINGKTGLDTFHGLSEGYGFIMSLRYTNNPATNKPYFTKEEVDAMLSDLSTGTTAYPGLYDVDNLPAKIDAMATKIANKFGFTVEDAKLGK